MSPLLNWLTAPGWTQIVGTLLHSLWQGALLALALAILMRRLSRPAIRYYAALGTLIVLALASPITWAAVNAPPSAPPAPPANSANDSFVAPMATPFDPDARDKTIVTATLTSPEPARVHWTAWLAFGWMCGSLLMLGAPVSK